MHTIMTHLVAPTTSSLWPSDRKGPTRGGVDTCAQWGATAGTWRACSGQHLIGGWYCDLAV